MKLTKFKEKKNKVKVSMEFTPEEFEILRNNGVDFYDYINYMGSEEYVLNLYAKDNTENYLTELANVGDLFWNKRNKKIVNRWDDEN